VLELRERLGLSAGQIRAVQDCFDRMSAAARQLGVEILAAERRLDEAFASGSILVDMLRNCELQGRLRAVHLAAHLETHALLGPEQIARYDAAGLFLRCRAGTRSSPA
jgi:hypothetical protein